MDEEVEAIIAAAENAAMRLVEEDRVEFYRQLQDKFYDLYQQAEADE